MRVQMPGSRNSGSGATVESGPVAAHKAQQSKAPVSMERAKSARRPMSQRATIWQRDSTSACIATKSVNLQILTHGQCQICPTLGITWWTLKGEQNISNSSCQVVGLQPLNHNKQKWKMFPNNNQGYGSKNTFVLLQPPEGQTKTNQRPKTRNTYQDPGLFQDPPLKVETLPSLPERDGRRKSRLLLCHYNMIQTQIAKCRNPGSEYH